MAINRERATMLGVLVAASLACLLGAVDPPPAGSHGGLGQETVDLVRVGSTTALAIALLLGPGILWRATSERRIGLAFLPLPGLALLIVTAGLAWALAGSVEPRLVCFAVFAPVLGLLLGGLIGAGQQDVLEPEEKRTLIVASLVLGVAIGRSLWSLGPAGELYAGGISRNLVAEPRPDSRISYFMPQLIAHGSRPYGPLATALFAPFNFSSRGPLPGMASAPIVFLTGGRPPNELPELPWQPFDGQGFMAYRIAMITFSCTVLLSLWELIRRIGGTKAARLALLLAATTPFLFADLWFTWPKLLAASFVLLGGLYIVERRALRSGLMVGIGYLMHPSALLGLSGIGLLALWPLRGANWRRPDLRAALLLVAGVAVSVLAWRVLNGHHYYQDVFLEYTTSAGYNLHPSLGTWINYRLGSLGNTLVPLMLPLFFAHDISINTLGGTSPPVIHFFFQYWTGLPFGVGIVFFPLLLVGLWRAWRLWPWPVLATVIVPLVGFTIYWGASDTGMLREGMQTWPLVLLGIVALQQARTGFGWLRSAPIRAILALRAVEVLAVALGPTLGTNHFRLVTAGFKLSDAAALVTMVACSLGLAALVWSTGRSRALD